MDKNLVSGSILYQQHLQQFTWQVVDNKSMLIIIKRYKAMFFMLASEVPT